MRIVARSLTRLAQTLDRHGEPEVAYAHCDVPCGLYDAFPAALAARTVTTMVNKMTMLPMPGPDAPPGEWLAYQNTFARYVHTKEQHAQICKNELLILWADYFNEAHLGDFPDLHETFWRAAKLCSRNKREANPEAAQELEDVVHQIAHKFEEAEKAAGKPKSLSGEPEAKGLYA